MSITKARTNVSIVLRILIINELLNKEKKKNQYLYKPGSVLEKPVPYHLSKRSTLHRVPKNSGEQPFHDDDIHELAASSRHSIVVTNYLVVSYTTFSPLPFQAVIFFCQHLLSPIACIFASGALYAARTFL